MEAARSGQTRPTYYGAQGTMRVFARGILSPAEERERGLLAVVVSSDAHGCLTVRPKCVPLGLAWMLVLDALIAPCWSLVKAKFLRQSQRSSERFDAGGASGIR